MPKNYAKLRVHVTWIIVGWIISILFMNILDGLWLVGHIPTTYAAICMSVPFIVNHTFHIDTLQDVTYLILLGFVDAIQ